MQDVNQEKYIWFYDIYKEVMQYNIAEHCWK